VVRHNDPARTDAELDEKLSSGNGPLPLVGLRVALGEKRRFDPSSKTISPLALLTSPMIPKSACKAAGGCAHGQRVFSGRART
jgi:hypothetical protein